MRRWYEQPGPEKDVFFCAQVSMCRNMPDLPFPARMSASDRERCRERVRRALCEQNAATVGQYHCVRMEDCAENEAVSLVERQLCTPEFIAQPEGRALFYTADEGSAVLVNGVDHVRLRVSLAGCQAQEALAAVDALDNMLDRYLRFAFHKNLGYLTEDPIDLGTGMIPSLRLHLPALQQCEDVERLSVDMAQMGFSLRGTFDNAAQPAGAVYELANRITLGISEKAALQNLLAIGGQLAERERRARAELLGTLAAQEALQSALRTLSQARTLAFDAFLQLYAKVRMGACAGILPGLRSEQLDSLLFAVQPATLNLRAGKNLTVQQRQERRAQMVSSVVTVGEG